MISKQALQAMITDIKGKSPIDGIHLAQLHFPNAKLAWAPESNNVRQILLVDEYVITFEAGKADVNVEIAPTVNQVATPEQAVKPKRKYTKKIKQPFVG